MVTVKLSLPFLQTVSETGILISHGGALGMEACRRTGAGWGPGKAG